ncbi:PEP-CTERM protein-sorting domain-containing protein [Terrimicrobium sacchariphilum]|uniref:PEP-CTERM protein-sorting domain-containing protein n=1 Tax=Terrimicrobium sacchariphilum TaxID=690879 RepID=A0A146GAV0_TERSA|nr:PEP-CTERM sorting domain-containing protein [Terrimicrobium sacchariphilum]GAT33954.1 PEP-CTERM protein-sorting domain-containing protein [Terrimicrobium sacchariphilum]
MIGNGFDGASTTTYWDSSWNELASSAGAAHVGYKWLNSSSKRWGTNTVSVSSFITNYGFGNVSLLGTTFNQIYDDAQVSTGDSGGGVFTSTGALAGILLASANYPSQPGNTSVIGDGSYFADMSVYGSRILAVVPEPSSFVLLGLAGILAAAMTRRRSRKRRI